MTDINNQVAYIWSLADLLRGDFKQTHFGRIILPFIFLRRLESVLEASKESVLNEYENIKKMNLTEEDQEKKLLQFTGGLTFFNKSKMDLSSLDESDLKGNLESYIRGFSLGIREIFECFNFLRFIDQLSDANLLYILIQKIRKIDLSPRMISNYEMGLVFEELIHRFTDALSETAGEHSTPNDVIQLVTSLVYLENDDVQSKRGGVCSVYDPTAGIGGFLSSIMEYIKEFNPQVKMSAYGQEINPESYAICKAKMLIEGQNITNFRLGNTLVIDRFSGLDFDYMLSHPPFMLSWKSLENPIKEEFENMKNNGRFGPGLPRVSDGTLLFLLHLISKMKASSEGGSRIGIILHSSSLFNGDAGSGESEIRRFLIEQDLLETIIALPSGLYTNTSISSYLLILTNMKNISRNCKIQIIDAKKLGMKMRNRIGSKSQQLDSHSIQSIIELYKNKSDGGISKIINSHDLGYRKVKLIVDDSKTEYERIPIGVDIDLYLKEHLRGIYNSYKVDESYLDEKVHTIGCVGYDFSINRIFNTKLGKGKQFRYYFDKVMVSDNWDFCISRQGHIVIFYKDFKNKDKSTKNYLYFKISKLKQLNCDYLAYFFKSKNWIEWLVTYRSNATVIPTNNNELWKKEIVFPSSVDQLKIVEILDGVNDWREKLKSIESDMWDNSIVQFSQKKYILPVTRQFEYQIMDIAPFPFANIIHHYKSIPDDQYKDRYELLLKLFEVLNIFIISIVIGILEREKKKDIINSVLKKQKKYLENATFGSWQKLLEKLLEKISDDSTDSFTKMYINDDIVSLFKKAVDIRNETTGHGSYPTIQVARETLKYVEEQFDDIIDSFYDLFNDYSLIRPITGKWDGENYKYQVEEFNGLGSYPFGSIETFTESPLIDTELYLISKTDNNNMIKLYPFIRLIDIEENSGLEAFYFYSKIQDKTKSLDEFLYISHQQINKQNQISVCKRLSSIFR